VTSFWGVVLTAVAAAGAVAGIIVSRRDREEQRLDHAPSIR
jgi:hypothetical protein